MTLSLEDAKLFFELMWKLQYYINTENGFHKDIDSFHKYANLPTEKKLKARDALWEHREFIESYTQKNPDALPPGELEIIRRWKDAIKGSFFLMRHLKKGSIFISKDDQVYAVHGIQYPLDELIPSHALPQMVEAVLLPFKGRIVYDGLLSGYNIHFGSGIRSDLNHTYAVAKNKNRIITTLEPDLVPSVVIKPRTNITPQLKDVSEILAKLKGDSPLQKSALSLALTSVELLLTEAQGALDAENQARKIFKASKRLLELLNTLDEE
jgi:hypothetical protein